MIKNRIIPYLRCARGTGFPKSMIYEAIHEKLGYYFIVLLASTSIATTLKRSIVVLVIYD